jgi:hypothetical protein
MHWNTDMQDKPTAIASFLGIPELKSLLERQLAATLMHTPADIRMSLAEESLRGEECDKPSSWKKKLKFTPQLPIAKDATA